MRDPGPIHIQKAIAHVVDHHQYAEPVLSDFALAVDKRPRLKEYFEGQVENVLSDPQAVAARFVAAEENPVADHCHQILTRPRTFNGRSQQLAKALFAAIGGNRSIAPGNFVVCTYRAERYPDVTFLALIKIDLTAVLIQEVETDSEGRQSVTYSVHENALPTLGRKLQKAAVVRLLGNPEPRYELLLLDRQVPQAAAEFFAAGFLGAEPIYTTRERTELFYDALAEAHKKLTTPPKKDAEPLLDLAAGNELLDQVRAVMTHRWIDSAALVDGLALPDPAKEVLQKTIRKRLTAEQFDLDPDHAREKVMPLRRFVGDFGIDVRFQADFENTIVTRSEQRIADDGTPITDVCLEVRNLKWVR